MSGRRLIPASAAVVGGGLLGIAPFLTWLGVQVSPRDAGQRSYTLSHALTIMAHRGLLGPGMSVVPLVAIGALAIVSGLAVSIDPRRGIASLLVLVGAAAGAYAAYLHAALEYAGFAIEGGVPITVRTTPGAGLLAAILGGSIILGSGLWLLLPTEAGRPV